MLSDHERRFLLTRRVGHLATADSRAIPHVVPVCFTISQGTLYITIDEKPKRVAGTALKRIRNIERNPMVAIVVADALTEKFGGDSIDEMLENWRAFKSRVAARFSVPAAGPRT